MPVRDPLTYKSTSQWAAWTPFAATWTATGTDPAIGNGQIQASYRRIGTTGFYRGVIVMGTTTTFGTGGWEVSLPDGWTASSALGSFGYQSGKAECYQASTTGAGCYVVPNGTVLNLWYGVTRAAVTGTAPAVWAANHFVTWGIRLELDYE